MCLHQGTELIDSHVNRCLVLMNMIATCVEALTCWRYTFWGIINGTKSCGRF